MTEEQRSQNLKEQVGKSNYFCPLTLHPIFGDIILNLKKLGLRIKQQREKQKLRQIDIANALQLSAQAVSKWERGENAPDISLILQLSKLLNINVEWLLSEGLPDNDTFEATVFCTSLNNFAEKSKTMKPKDLAMWTNGLFYNLTEVVLKYNGVPVKYVGDGFLAFFTGEDAQNHAVDAASNAKRLIEDPNLVIALHHGSIFLGTIGHPDYSSRDILGDTVNTCFLVMPWVSQNCITKVGATETVVTNKTKKLKLCGKTTIAENSNVQIFELRH